jgi:predicted aconitase
VIECSVNAFAKRECLKDRHAKDSCAQTVVLIKVDVSRRVHWRKCKIQENFERKQAVQFRMFVRMAIAILVTTVCACKRMRTIRHGKQITGSVVFVMRVTQGMTVV